MRRTWREREGLRALLGGCALVLLLGHAGCLNPRPEEDPSASVEGVPSPADLEPPRDACMSNPALPECSVPIRGGESEAPPADLDVDDGASDPDVAAGAPPEAAPAPPVDAGSSAADTTSDAGLAVEPADASSP